MAQAPSKPSRLTAHSGEADVGAFLSGEKIFSIPYFQRSYNWRAKQQVERLNQDLLRLVDGETDVHFLGAIIFHGRRVNPSDPVIYDIIDGQQRITTLYLYICAVVKYLCGLKRHEEAAGLCQNYLVINRPTGVLSNIKLHPSKGDRKQLNSVIQDLFEDKILRELVTTSRFKYLPSTGNAGGTMFDNYKYALNFLKKQQKQSEEDRAFMIYYNLLFSLTLVQIDVIDATNGPKIYGSLNSRQLPTTIGDLVRNEVFAKKTDQDTTEDEIERIDADHWRPFYERFQFNQKNYFDDYFFPFGLISHPDLRKSDVYSTLQDDWRTIQDPIDIISKLAAYQSAFIDLIACTNSQGHTKPIAMRFENLSRLGAPAATYPFLMRLSNAILAGEVLENDASETLLVVESFLVRRAICGYDPTGLHAVFKRLWKASGGKPTSETITDLLRGARTVAWPKDDEFVASILSRPLYSIDVTKFLILEYDRSLCGDTPNIKFEAEHVLPVHPDHSWNDHFPTDKREKMKDLLANLLPISKEMNKEVSNGPYVRKRAIFAEDAAFKSTRAFAIKYQEWTPTALEERSVVLADWAKLRWPY